MSIFIFICFFGLFFLFFFFFFFFFFLRFLIQVDFALFIQNIPGIRNKCQLINLKVSLAVFSCLVCLFIHAAITLRITVFTLYLCAESLKNPVLISSEGFSFLIPIINPCPFWKRWRGRGRVLILL